MKNEQNTSAQGMQELAARKKIGYLMQDIGMLFFLGSLFVASVATALGPESARVESCIMFAVMAGAVLLAAYKFYYLAIATAAVQVVVFSVYRIYQSVANHVSIGWTAYVWVIVPLTAVASMLMFQQLNFRLENANEVLASQMESLILVHALTGLYNQRALYRDLERQISYSKRNKLNISLLCIQLRYADELKQILTRMQFERLQQNLATFLEDCLRLEDQLYAMDDNGYYIAMLTCDAAGAAVVKRRILSNLDKAELLGSEQKNAVRVELRMAFLQYDAEKIANVFEFKRKAESELQYDV
jgi:GGDEF domain-containing protein